MDWRYTVTSLWGCLQDEKQVSGCHCQGGGFVWHRDARENDIKRKYISSRDDSGKKRRSLSAVAFLANRGLPIETATGIIQGMNGREPVIDLCFLGTGTSVGVPMIGCDCGVCRSPDPRNRRRRTCLYLQAGGVSILIDTPPDLREQVLSHDVRRVDAVLFTHAHADHIFGLDDIRRFNTIQHCVIPVYAPPATLDDVRRIFGYADHTRGRSSGEYRPLLDFQPVSGPFDLGAVRVLPVEVEHGNTPTVGYRIDCCGRSLGYAPDCHAMPEAALNAFQGVEVMILDGLRHRPHRSHLTVSQSLDVLRRIGAPSAYLVHICHDLDHADEQSKMPRGVSLSWDGLRLRW